MKVILKEDVDNLGDMGNIVNVARGYARNYLVPKKLAVEAIPRNIRALEHEKRVIAEKVNKLKMTAAELAARLSSVELSIIAKAGEEGKLFGSVTAKDIVDVLSSKGYHLDRKKLVLDNPIKRIGEHTVKVRLHTDVVATINVRVVPE